MKQRTLLRVYAVGWSREGIMKVDIKDFVLTALSVWLLSYTLGRYTQCISCFFTVLNTCRFRQKAKKSVRKLAIRPSSVN